MDSRKEASVQCISSALSLQIDCFEKISCKLVVMKLTVKTLKGVKFQVDVEESNTVEQVKGIIVSDPLALRLVYIQCVLLLLRRFRSCSLAVVQGACA